MSHHKRIPAPQISRLADFLLDFGSSPQLELDEASLLMVDVAGRGAEDVIVVTQGEREPQVLTFDRRDILGTARLVAFAARILSPAVVFVESSGYDGSAVADEIERVFFFPAVKFTAGRFRNRGGRPSMRPPSSTPRLHIDLALQRMCEAASAARRRPRRVERAAG